MRFWTSLFIVAMIAAFTFAWTGLVWYAAASSFTAGGLVGLMAICAAEL